jgi:hypothetical protein
MQIELGSIISLHVMFPQPETLKNFGILYPSRIYPKINKKFYFKKNIWLTDS